MSDPLMPTVEVTEDGVEVHSPEVRSTTDEVELLPLKGLLGLETLGSRQASQLKAIHDYIAPKANGTGDLLYQFKQLENRLSAPRLGESRLSKVYNYVKLQNQIGQLEEQRNTL